MELDQQVSKHYGHGNLLKSIEAGLTALGKSPQNVTIEDLSPVDEFHIGGRLASKHFLDQLSISPNMSVLDIGCGLGGAARFTAAHYQANVTGIDLTREYIETGQALCEWVGSANRVTLLEENALSMSFESGRFDCAYMMHVGMNIEDKLSLFAEIYRVLSPGSVFGIYDIMRIEGSDLTYPVPWASQPATSWLVTPENYKHALQQAGFTIVSEESRRDFALDFFANVQKINKANGGPPPLGLHTLMQSTAADKVANMVKNIAAGSIAPFEIIAKKS